MISGREQTTFREDGDDVRFVLDQNDLLDFDIFSTLKHQSTEIHVVPVFVLTF